MIRILAAAALLLPSAAHAQEIFAGVFAHGVDTPLTFDTGEGGTDIQAGIRGDPILNAGIATLRPYALVSVNTRGDTDFAAAGLSLSLGLGGWFVRPAIGVAVHDGPSYRVDPADNVRTDLGSRVLFAPELAIGTGILPGVSVEAAWTHLSHAQVFGKQNPGLDMVGTRVSIALP